MTVGPGTVLGDRYKVERKLARGGMAEVWVATDTRFNAPVAVKVAAPPADGRQDWKVRFKREAVIGRLLGSRSTGFVRALDWGELPGGALFLVMDLIEGAQPLDPTQGARNERLRRLVTGARLVQELHALGIVHRDVKPANFLLSRDGTLRLGDFGLARLADEPDAEDPLAGATRSGVALGTPFYMAPEQVDAKHVDQRADVYPLGVMLFQALTARLPYSGTLPQLLARQQRVLRGQEPAPRPRQHDETIPPELDALCLEALQPDPKRRLRSAVAFADRLEAWLSRSAVVAQAGAAPVPAAAPPPASAAAGSTRAAPPPPPPGLAEVVGQEGIYRWERDGSHLVWIPPGFFYPGARDDDPGKTLTQVKVQGHYLGRVPVTWRQWGRFCKDTGRPAARPLFPAGEDHPVHGVTWDEAQAYCQWAGLRLPDEAEWEYAARGEDPRRYPWGDQEPGPAHMNWSAHPEHHGSRTTPVGSFPRGASPFGVLDMAGNVQEWLSGAHPPGLQPVRGGAFHLPAAACRPSERVLLPADAREPGVGFRVALSRGAAPADTADDLERKRTTRRFGRAELAAVVGVPPRANPPASRPAPPPPAPARRPAPAPATARAAAPAARPPTERRPRPAPAARPSTGPAPRPAPPAPRPAPPPPTRPVPAARPAPPPPPRPAPPQPAQAATGRRGRLTPAQEQLLEHMEALLASFAGGSARKGNELKFTSGEPPVSWSFLALDPDARWACLEQRVTFDPEALQGSPSGRVNLLLATNLITHYGRGIRCVVTDDRLRFRRELFLSPGSEPLLPQELRANLDVLLAGWTAVFGPLREVQEGKPWHEALAPLLEPRPPGRAEVLEEIQAALAELEPEQEGHRLRLLLPGLEQPVELTWCEDLAISTLVRPWTPSPEEAQAVKYGEEAPQVEALLEELNEKNASRPYALSWDPRRGVVGRAFLAGEPPPRARIMDVLALLEHAARNEELASLEPGYR